MQGWEFTHLLIAHHSFAHRSSLICSVAHLLTLLRVRTNERMWAIRSGQLSEWANCSVFWANPLFFSFAHKEWAICSKFEKIVFFVHFVQLFWSFLKNQKIRSFLVSEVSEWLWSLRTNERPWAICSGRSEGMSDREQIAQVAWQKQAIRSEIRWANSQPCPHAKFFLGGKGA